jgi:hypothetical protein
VTPAAFLPEFLQMLNQRLRDDVHARGPVDVLVLFGRGSMLVGEWRRDQPEGDTQVIFPDGKTLVGNFVDGKCHLFRQDEDL